MKRNGKMIKEAVKKTYGRIAERKQKGCCSSASCCGSDPVEAISRAIGYSEQETKAVPEGANLGLGCGNPVAIASLKKGEVVLDLGSGAGFDAFLAASKVGKSGKVIGVDMTPEMTAKAGENALKGGYKNVEFRLGEIESLPVDSGSVDVIISNCVINLSTDKKKVFAEAFRVLKPGGRLMISDLVLLKKLPKAVKESLDAYTGCVAGAVLKDEYLALIKKAGFIDVDIIKQDDYPAEENGVTVQMASIKVSALKPAAK